MKKWIFRTSVGQIYGPFEKEKVEELLLYSKLTGEEEVAEYPAGEWKNFSHDQELAEILLKTLSLSGAKQKTQSKINQEKIVTKKLETKTLKTKKTDSTQIPRKNKLPQGPPPELVLTQESKMQKKTNIIPLIILLFAFILVVYGYQQKRDLQKGITISLIKPQFKKGGDPAKSQALVKTGWTYFYKDTFKNYVTAQEYFVKAVEESPQNLDAIIMLLMTDIQLWPFARQDSQDQEVIKSLVQQASRTDTYGSRRLLASAIAESVLSSQQSNKSLVDSGLQQQPSEGRFYYLKAQNFYNSSEFEQALSYYDKVKNLMPYWVKSYYQIALCYEKQGQAALAQQYLNQVLKMNPQHKAALLELGIIEQSFYNHSSKAVELINAALAKVEEKLLPAREARARYWLAFIYQANSNFSKAKQEIEKAYQLAPSDMMIEELFKKLGGEVKASTKKSNEKENIAFGDQYMRLKNYLGAQAQYKAALELNPKNATAALKVAEALWKLNQASEATKYLERAIALDPKLVTSYVQLSEIKTLRFDFEGAAKVLAHGLKANPKSYEIYKAYAQYFLKRGDLISADNFIQRALQIYEADSSQNLLASQIYLTKKELAKAQQYAKRALSLDSRNVEAQVNFAKILMQNQSVKSAVEYLRDLINTYPSELSYRVAMGEILIQDEQYTSAEQVLNQVLAFDNNHKEAHQLLGDSYFLNSKYNEALLSYFNVSRLDPSDASGVFRAGEAYTKLGKYNEALKQFQLALSINPLFPRTRYNIAKVFFSLGQADEALKQLGEEKKLNPRLSDPYELSGDIYLSTRKFAKATQEYQKASELKPQGALIYIKLAKAYRAQHSLDAAAAMLRLAIAKESGVAEIYKEQGLIFEQKGQAKEAVISFEQYLRLDPNPPDKAQILDKIKVLEE
ncbi:MAG: tetratricopeptide repeat protein [Oligoflexia bacterium]|nr:tetratricopeptide repeat protein [Oligoflexia bacterium]